MPELDGKWFSPFMAEIHGTLGCLAANKSDSIIDLRDYDTSGMSFKVATAFQGTQPTEWKTMTVGDPHEAMRVKVLEMLGSEGPKTADIIHNRLPFSEKAVDRILQRTASINRWVSCSLHWVSPVWPCPSCPARHLSCYLPGSLRALQSAGMRAC